MTVTQQRASLAALCSGSQDHVADLERLRGPVTVVRQCESLPELLAVAQNGLVDVLLISGETDLLTLTFLERLEAQGGRPVGVVAASELESERRRLDGLGVEVCSPEIPPQELADLVLRAASQARGGSLRRARPSLQSAPSAFERPGADPLEALLSAPITDAAADEDTRLHRPSAAEANGSELDTPREKEEHGSDPVLPVPPAPVQPAPVSPASASETSVPEAPGGQTPGTAGGGDAPGRITAVWGPAGSPGRTTVAVNLAVELALAGRRTLLVDLDTYASSVGAHLGLLEESAGIARACHAADQGRLSETTLRQAVSSARVAGVGVDVLTGLTRADRWPELRPSALDAVLAASSIPWDEVVVDTGFCLEQDEELSFDVPAPQRNAATLAALRAADRILAVGTGDPVGLPRLIRGLDELQGLGTSASVEVLVNQVRAEATGVGPQAQVQAVWDRFGPDRPLAGFLPWDRSSLDRALLSGQVLAEIAPKSALRRALQRWSTPCEASAHGRT